MKVAAIYARLSGPNQDHRGIHPRELTEYCARHDFKAAGKYVDVGWKFTQLDRLIKDAHHGWFDYVIIWRFDKSALSAPHLLRALDAFDSLAIEYVTPADDIDTTTPSGKALFMSNLERSLIGEQLKSRFRVFRTRTRRTWQNLKGWLCEPGGNR
jgi:DNA invertase Pin-like site-specific DNA recombinase